MLLYLNHSQVLCKRKEGVDHQSPKLQQIRNLKGSGILTHLQLNLVMAKRNKKQSNL